MLTRIISGLVLLALLGLTLWSVNPIPFSILVLVAVILGLHEFHLLAGRVGLTPARIPAFVAAVGVLLCFYYGRTDLVIAPIAGLTIIELIRLLGRPAEFDRAVATAATGVFGLVYVAVLAGFAIGIKQFDATTAGSSLAGAGQAGSRLLAFFLLIVVADDSGAYFSGRALGRHKLAPKISPGKTIEGSVGGLLLSLAAAVIGKIYLVPGLGWQHLVFLTIILVGFGTLGDLAESMLKRGAGAKDAASLIPGHGGVLDRLDSLLFNAPIVFYYYQFFLK